ncbi:GNAT family N-acetyltransferase [Paenibacillus alkalitolerans]|uniref:GNAT family N-acetyltransferase n=1 Tax=Paenibacillus alkalitolerans TaxID=2799335 RepID=UPI0018F77FA6|nr:GNAT family N-acetyltransferase [Paenibacillus alkalitolerans]
MQNLIKDAVQLRDVTERDLPIFFEYQLDASSNYMAAFTPEDPSDKAAFMNRWSDILANENIIKKTILYNEYVVGNILNFIQFGEPAVGYWIGRQYWGKGIATSALSKFLDYVKVRPLYARAAKDNIGSVRVLEKCGFKIYGEDKGFSNARNEEVEEYILKLDA